MSLEQVLAAPFAQSGSERLTEQEIVVALSLHRDWFSPAQAKRVVEIGMADGLLTQEDDELIPAFDLADVSVPASFEPDESMLTRRSTFEQILDRLAEQDVDKREGVAAINQIQSELGITIDAAACIYAIKQGVPVTAEMERIQRDLEAEIAAAG